MLIKINNLPSERFSHIFCDSILWNETYDFIFLWIYIFFNSYFFTEYDQWAHILFVRWARNFSTFCWLSKTKNSWSCHSSLTSLTFPHQASIQVSIPSLVRKIWTSSMFKFFSYEKNWRIIALLFQMWNIKSKLFFKQKP